MKALARKPLRCTMPLLAAAVLGAAAMAQEDWPKPTVVAVPTVDTLAINGLLDEPAWSLAQWQGGFTSASSGPENSGPPRPATVQTRFKVLYDAWAIYVGVECDEPAPEGIRAEATGHDSMVFMDDCVEVFLDPAGEGRYYHHFVVNSRGAWYDDYGADFGLVHNRLWDCPLEIGTVVDAAARKWTAELRIPLAGLILHPDAGSRWLWNVTRERYAGGAQELTSWSPLKGNFHTPQRFGTLADVNVDFRRFALDVTQPQVSISSDGSGRVRLALSTRVTNGTGADLSLRAWAMLFGEPQTKVNAEPVTLASGATTDVALPALVRRGDTREANVVLALADEDGNLRKLLTKRLSAEYRPVTITVLRPCYRNSIYATEKLDRIQFRVALAEDVAAQAASVRCTLALGERVLQETTTTVADLAQPVELDARDLAEGRYDLTARVLGADGVLIAQTQTTIRKLPPPPVGTEVRVDEHGNILVNGKPFLGIGWYGAPNTDDPRADVVALQNLQTPVVVVRPDFAGLREPFAQHGIYSIVSVENGRVLYSFELWRFPDHPVPTEHQKLPAPSEEMADYLRQIVEGVRAEPGLLGYYISDEPEINNVRSDYLEAHYRLMCELDPYHPVIVTNDTLDGIVTHGYRCADILSPDPYSPEFDYVPNFMKRCREVMGPGQTILLTPWHSTSQTHFTADWGSGPPYSYRVMRNQYLVSIAYGARGFTAYTSSFFMPEIEYRYGLPYIWREVRFLERAISAPAPDQPLRVQADAEMASWIRSVDGLLYLIVVNHKPGARRATVSHPLLSGVHRLIVVSEAREVQVQDGSFGDDFAQGDARIYTTDPRGAAFDTTRAIEAELARREAEAVKPGNLLHVSRGVRASASDGYYAPWFNQYYYYAINGIPDDIGWTLSHAGGKPGWLELALPQPATVGHVVLYTPNLRDYDLEFRGPDGAIRVAQVRGNEQTIVVHNFDPPVPCLKLRITALAARSGHPRLSEVEAYETRGVGPTTPLVAVAEATPVPETHIGAVREGTQNALWSDDFTNFRSRDRYYWDGQDVVWVADPQRHQVTPRPGGGIVCTSPQEGSGMSRILPYDPAYRFFQVKIGAIEGEGYRFVNVGFGNSSGRPGYRGAVNTNRPGIYTVDTHYVSERFRNGEDETCFVTTYMGPIRCTFDWMRLVQRPEDGLAVTLADGSPLPEVLERGDEILLHLILSEPAADATVSVLAGPGYVPLALNGQPTVQLVKAGNGDGREWAAKVKLGEGTGSFDFPASGYPLVFRANILGGTITETYASACVSIR